MAELGKKPALSPHPVLGEQDPDWAGVSALGSLCATSMTTCWRGKLRHGRSSARDGGQPQSDSQLNLGVPAVLASPGGERRG